MALKCVSLAKSAAANRGYKTLSKIYASKNTKLIATLKEKEEIIRAQPNLHLLEPDAANALNQLFGGPKGGTSGS